MRLVNALRNNFYVDWNTFRNREMLLLCDLYIEIGWVKKHKDQYMQFRHFLHAVDQVDDKKKDIIWNIISSTRGMRDFLIIHSVFSVDALTRKDWLGKFMASLLYATDEDVARLYETPKIPEEVMKKLAFLDPEPIPFFVYPIRIEYVMWGSRDRGESYEPVNVVETDWEKVRYEVATPTIVKEFISRFDVIDSTSGRSIPVEESYIDDSDLPF